MLDSLRGLVVFSVMVALVLGALRLLSWVPEAVQEGTFRRFETVDEAKEHLKISRFDLPAFYPENVRWPPLLIAGQTRPYPAMLTEFGARDRDGVYLVITQTVRPHPPLGESIRLDSIREQVRYPVKSTTALLQVGSCPGGESCSRISWQEGPVEIALAMKAAPLELVRMAESMIPGGPTGNPAPDHRRRRP